MNQWLLLVALFFNTFANAEIASDYLQKLVILQDHSDGKRYVNFATSRDEDSEHLAAIRALSGKTIRSILAKSQQPISLPIQSSENSERQTQTLASSFALQLLAASVLDPEQTHYRRVFFQDESKNTYSLIIQPAAIEDFAVVETIAELFLKNEAARLDWTFLPRRSMDGPADKLVEYSSSKHAYLVSDNEKAVEAWRTKRLAFEVLGSEIFQDFVTEKMIEKQDFLTSEDLMAIAVEEQMGPFLEIMQQPAVMFLVETELRKSLSLTLDPTDKDNLIIETQPIGTRIPMARASEENPRLAIVFHSNVQSPNAASCRVVGAKVVFAGDLTEAAAHIEKFVSETGKTADVIFADHGFPGNMAKMRPNTAALKNFTLRTRHLIRRATFMGCSTGASVQSKHHILRELACGWCAPCRAFDRTVLCGGDYRLSSPGNLIWVQPNFWRLKK